MKFAARFDFLKKMLGTRAGNRGWILVPSTGLNSKRFDDTNAKVAAVTAAAEVTALTIATTEVTAAPTTTTMVATAAPKAVTVMAVSTAQR